MFGKRKAIVIGETYIFDALNETNMGVTTSLVTVIKKAKKRNQYTVLSVNNGDIFDTPAKFLTPYVDPKNAAIVRCHYGTTEFLPSDILILDMLSDLVNIIINIQTRDEEKKIIDMDFATLKILIKKTRDKIEKYVTISKYCKTLISTANLYESLNIEEINFDNKDKDNAIECSFKDSFDSIVDKYVDGEIDQDDFIDEAINVIKKKYPLPALKIGTPTTIDSYGIESLVMSIYEKILDNHIVFVVSKTQYDDIVVDLLMDENTTDDQIRDFIQDIYSDYKKDDDTYIADFNMGIISVEKRDGDI